MCISQRLNAKFSLNFLALELKLVWETHKFICFTCKKCLTFSALLFICRVLLIKYLQELVRHSSLVKRGVRLWEVQVLDQATTILPNIEAILVKTKSIETSKQKSEVLKGAIDGLVIEQS